MKKSADDDMEALRTRLQEAEDTLDAIRQGAVDALVVRERDTQQIYTLKSADHTYRVLIESMNQAAMTISEDGTILYSNSQFSWMTGQPLEQIIGMNLAEFFKPEDQPMIVALIERRRRDNIRELECDLPGKNYISVIVSATKLPGVEANAYMSIIITDITERRRSEKAKDEFISLASHQLRTPATAVKQYLGMLLEGYAGDLLDNQKVFINTAYTSNEKQLGIINSILRTAQIDSGVYTLKKTPCNLAALVDTILDEFEAVIMMRQQKIVCDIDESIEIEADAAELSVALINLIENASKYSPNDKKIQISASQSPKLTTIHVRDRGVGIAPADQAKIFEKFTRVDNAMSDTVNGSGLGLYWVQRIIATHGGSIRVDSVLGTGTTFTIKLPR